MEIKYIGMVKLEMGILTEIVEMKWNGANRKHFESLGHIYTKPRDSFFVKIEDLTKGSRWKIQIKCDICNLNYNVTYLDLIKSRSYKENGRHGLIFCQKCSISFYNSKTNEEFIKEIFDLTLGEYELLGNYQRTNKKVKMKHLSCGEEFFVAPNSFLSGGRCPHCSKTGLKTNKKFVKEIFSLVGNEYSLHDEYKGNRIKIKFRHEICKHEWYATPCSFLRGSRCPLCMRKLITTESFKLEIAELVGSDYILLGRYEKANKKTEMKHVSCGNTYLVTPSKFLNGRRCPKCFGTTLKTHEEFLKDVRDSVGLYYHVLGKYINNSTNIEILHIECGYKFYVTPANFLGINGTRCSKCNNCIQNKTTEYFIDEIKQIFGEEIQILGQYISTKNKILVRHYCDYEWEANPSTLLKGHGCPKCLESKGEKRISEFLSTNNIIFTYQYRNEKCKNKYILPFDFALVENSHPILIIEYDGEQHERPIEFFGGEKAFRSLVKRDKIKTNYCITNNIPLLRISYRDYERIKEILTFELIKLNINIAV